MLNLHETRNELIEIKRLLIKAHGKLNLISVVEPRISPDQDIQDCIDSSYDHLLNELTDIIHGGETDRLNLTTLIDHTS